MRKRVDVTHEILKRKVLTIPEVSEYLRVSRQTIYRMLKRGDIPAFRIGGDWRFNIEDLGHWIEKESQARKKFERDAENLAFSSVQLAACQLLPRSKVLKPEPSAAAMSATSALAADTLTRSAVVGDLIRCHRVPSVVSRIVPLRPTTQHTVFDTAWPANKSDCTPLSCCCQLF